jgi:multicomponent Na+:H+ antiporter subunit G
MIPDLAFSIAALLVVAGAVFSLLAAIGIVRLPDLYTRLHAASKAGLVGAGLVLLAVAFAALDLAVIFRAIAGVIFLFLTTPISAHLLARAAFLTGQQPLTNAPAETQPPSDLQK